MITYLRHLERETGFEPATNSLEGCDSSQLSYSRIFKKEQIEYSRKFLLQFYFFYSQNESAKCEYVW